MKKNVDLTEGTIWKQLLLFCLPIMFGTLFQQLYNAVDVVVVGQFVGADAIAPYYMLVAFSKSPAAPSAAWGSLSFRWF